MSDQVVAITCKRTKTHDHYDYPQHGSRILRFAYKIVILANGKVKAEFSKQGKANLTHEILAKAMG